MDLNPYIETVRRNLAVAAEAGGDEARALADRLTAPLESGMRLALLDALSAAADEITRELAPAAIELRLRAGDPEFVVAAPPAPPPVEPEREPLAPPPPPPPPPDADDGATARINLRLPEHLKADVEQAAARERLSVNAWLVRIVAAAVAGSGDRDPRPGRRSGRIGQSYTGWVR